MYERILWAHDGSDRADAALPHVVALARAFDSAVVVCSVIEIDEGVGVTETRRAEGVVSSEALDRAEGQLRAEGIALVRKLVMQGLADRALVDTALMEDADLVVMTTRGRSGITRALLGSVSETVARGTPGIAVLVVQPAEDDALA